MASKELELIDEAEWSYTDDVGGEMPQTNGGVRTYFVFVDLPQHIEFRVTDMPILQKGMEIELDMSLRHPRNIRKVRKIEGVHTVLRRLLKYSTTRASSMGLSQYIELIKGPAAK
jgi:hypothetical protein